MRLLNISSKVNFPVINARTTVNKAKKYRNLINSKKKTKSLKLKTNFENNYKIGILPKFYVEAKERLVKEKENENLLQSIIRKKNKKEEILGMKEKQELLKQLRLRWEEINDIYQRTTHRRTYNSDNKKKRKEFLENVLENIEKDIKKINIKNLQVDLTK